MPGHRPEVVAPPEIYYDIEQARKYTTNARVLQIQKEMTSRALELLDIKGGPKLILDIGCGSGLSSQVIEESGHRWIGLDISRAMLDVARQRKEDGELDELEIIQSDIGDGLPFKPGSFDAAVSISALQWLCNADKKIHHPAKRLLQLFSTLYTCLTREGKAVFQFYPANMEQYNLINKQAERAGFTGGLVVDNPNSSRAKKYFLVLSCGATRFAVPEPISDRPRKKNEGKKSRDWIIKKKERRRRQGIETRPDTRYTGRKRSGRF